MTARFTANRRMALQTNRGSAAQSRAWLVVAAVCLLFTGAHIASASGRAETWQARCLRPGDRIEFQTSRVVVVTNSRLAVRETEDFSVFGCVKRLGRRYRVDRRPHGREIEIFRPAGRFVATVSYGFVSEDQDPETPSVFVSMVDLTNGDLYRVARHLLNPLGVVVDLELKSNGSLAFLVVRGFEPDSGFVRELVACEIATCYSSQRRATKRRVLDSGFIDDSFSLTGSTLRWRKEGMPRSAVLR